MIIISFLSSAIGTKFSDILFSDNIIGNFLLEMFDNGLFFTIIGTCIIIIIFLLFIFFIGLTIYWLIDFKKYIDK